MDKAKENIYAAVLGSNENELLKNIHGIIFYIFILLILGSGPSEEYDFGESGQEKIVNDIKSLESNPFQDGHKIKRSNIIKWIIKNPSLSIKWCPGPLISGKNDLITPYLSTQGILEAGKYLIEHPDKSDDQLEMHTAAIKGAMRMYSIAKKIDQKYADPVYDILLEKIKMVGFKDTVKTYLKHCYEENKI